MLIPTNEAELKPKDPLYQMAFERSHDRPYALFIGDDLQEVEAARRNGMAAYHFPLSKKFLDPEKIPALLHRQLGQPAKPTQNVVAAPEQAASVGNAP
ncbi:MAG: hypothetical protein R3C68_10820 [Myxococcota bacterium]